MARSRRGRSEGSIYQRKDGTWTASLSLGYDGNGKRKRRTVYGATKTEVREKLTSLQNDLASGNLSDTDKMTVGQFLDRWLQIVKPTVEPNTYRPYERHVRLHLQPIIGRHKLAKLTALHIEAMYVALAEKGVSAAMQRKLGTTLTIALNHALRLKMVLANVATVVRKPKAIKPEMTPLDPDQVARFQAAARGDRLFPLYATMLDSGAGPGELFALLWPDIDFDAGCLTITKSLEEIAGVHRVKEVKAKRRRRRVQLTQHVLDILHDHRKNMLVEGRDVKGGLVFCDTGGGFLRQSNVARYSFKPILKRAGLPAVRPYDLRHTCATLLLLAGENPKVVAERLGHASTTMTMDIYSHVLPTMQKKAAEKLNLILSQKPAPPEAKASY